MSKTHKEKKHKGSHAENTETVKKDKKSKDHRDNTNKDHKDELPQIPLPKIEAPTAPPDRSPNKNRRDQSPLEKSPRTLIKPGQSAEKKEKRKSLNRKTGIEIKDMNMQRIDSDTDLVITRCKSNSLPGVIAVKPHHHHGHKKQSQLTAIKSEEQPNLSIFKLRTDSSESITTTKERPHKFELITLQYENQTRVLVIDVVKTLSTFLPIVCRKFDLLPLPSLDTIFLVYVNTPDDPLPLDKTWLNIRTSMILADMPKDNTFSNKSSEEKRDAKKKISERKKERI